MSESKDLIWVEEAKIVYKHSREWLCDVSRMVDCARFYCQVRPNVYLVRSELERYLQEHATERD